MIQWGGMEGRLWGRRVTGLALSGEGQICYVHMTMKNRAWNDRTAGFGGYVETQ